MPFFRQKQDSKQKVLNKFEIVMEQIAILKQQAKITTKQRQRLEKDTKALTVELEKYIQAQLDKGPSLSELDEKAKQLEQYASAFTRTIS